MTCSSQPQIQDGEEQYERRRAKTTREAAHFFCGKGNSMDNGKKLNEDLWKMPGELDHQLQLQP